MLAGMPQAVRSVPGAGRQGEDRVLTVPNALSALRLVCLPVFVVLLAQPHERGRPAAAFLLAGAAFTDLLDGYIARHFDQVSTLGKMADPLVDRALVLCALVGATVIGALPIWLVVVIALREGVVLAGSGLLFFFSRTTRIDVSRAGKAGALGMMMALPLFILAHAPFRYHEAALVVAWVAVGAGQVLAWAAVVQYVPKARSAWAAGRRATPEAGAMTPSGPGAR
jgi:cardiolipin synthase